MNMTGNFGARSLMALSLSAMLWNYSAYSQSTPAPTNSAPGSTTPAPPTKPVVSAQGCVDDGTITKGIADFRVNTYCKRQAIREQYKGKIDENVFNFDLSIGMGLESSLKDAMGSGGG